MYLSLRFDVDADSAEAWCDALLAHGALAVEVSDPNAGSELEVPVYGEPGAAARWWPLSRVAALFAGDVDTDGALVHAAAALGAAVPPAEQLAVADQDWVRATQAQFEPIRIDDGLWIVPTWCSPPDAGAINLSLDPGLAFGTGSHATTRLCLEWLRAALKGGERVLDYGCGSGILAIGAARMGARAVTGIDIDPQAVTASRANAQANGVAATFGLPDALPGESAGGRYDVVVANILANPLIVLAPLLAARTEPGGRIALSGVLVGQADEVTEAYARWFNIAAWRDDDGWILLAGVRRRATAPPAAPSRRPPT